jgi:hypothetical protein
MYVTLEIAKLHLRVEDSYTDEDAYIESLIDVAEEKIAEELCISVEELANVRGRKVIPKPLFQAILLSVGLYYNNREEVTCVQTKPLEQGVKHLVSLYRNYSK